jgi:MazG family protein
MERLRDDKNGCEWDKEQTFESIAPFTIEEAYEVADAIAKKNPEDIKLELGDLLLQVVFLSQIAKENGLFSFEDVCEAITKKLITRHPYVFKEKRGHTSDEQLVSWENTKAAERKKKNLDSLMDDVALNLPALMRSQKIQKRAARVGFNWDSLDGYFSKAEEEILELKEAIKKEDQENIEEEVGDILMVFSNLARHLKVDAENALGNSNRKFEKRFRYIEDQLQNKKENIEKSSLEEMDKLWDEAKLID